MAITLCQSLGQNIGMRWNNARTSAGRILEKVWKAGMIDDYKWKASKLKEEEAGSIYSHPVIKL